MLTELAWAVSRNVCAFLYRRLHVLGPTTIKRHTSQVVLYGERGIFKTWRWCNELRLRCLFEPAIDMIARSREETSVSEKNTRCNGDGDGITTSTPGCNAMTRQRPESLHSCLSAMIFGRNVHTTESPHNALQLLHRRSRNTSRSTVDFRSAGCLPRSGLHCQRRRQCRRRSSRRCGLRPGDS
jgi:hypothetical protein